MATVRSTSSSSPPIDPRVAADKRRIPPGLPPLGRSSVNCIAPGVGYDSVASNPRARQTRALSRNGVGFLSGVSLPVTRPTGRALIVGSPSCRAAPLSILQRMGFTCAEADDPYAAMLELSRRPLVYRALILSLQSLFREELSLISTAKRRLPHVEIWLTQTDGRQALLADAMRLGADGLLAEDGLHRIAGSTVAHPPVKAIAEGDREESVAPRPGDRSEHDLPDETPIDEPVLSADELRALLQEQPSLPPSGET